MFMCVVNWKSVNKLDLTWKQSFLILGMGCFGFVFALVRNPIMFAMAQLFPASLAGEIGQCSAYLSFMSMVYMKQNMPR